MRRRTASNKTEVVVENEEKQHLSGAYIRSLVRHLSSSRNCQEKLPVTGTTSDQRPQPRVQPKKQVRRRFHTSRPYQERLLDMAEARREIVAALKFHRAKMRNSSTDHHLRDILPSPSSSSSSSSAKATVLLPPALPDYAWSSYYASAKNFIAGIPKPPLGLNLNMDRFDNLEQPPSLFSSSATTTTTTSAESEVRLTQPYHPTMDDRQMEQIRSIAERHDMEWNDKLNSAPSAWWCCNHLVAGDESVFAPGSDGINGIGTSPWFQDTTAGASATTSSKRDYNFPW